jgi:5-formyltetrahydrofolate cyclo-ligase
MPSGEIQTEEIVRHALNAGKEVFVPYLHRNSEIRKSGDEGGAIEAPKRIMDMVRLRGVGDYEGLERDKWGIPTVTEKGVEGRERVLGEGGSGSGRRGVKLDLMLMPGVAFDVDEAQGVGVRRLGHGKGFYDYFLHRYRNVNENGTEKGESARMALFGLALKEQFLRDEQELHVPIGPHDSLLEGLVVGDGQVIKPAPL